MKNHIAHTRERAHTYTHTIDTPPAWSIYARTCTQTLTPSQLFGISSEYTALLGGLVTLCKYNVFLDHSNLLSMSCTSVKRSKPAGTTRALLRVTSVHYFTSNLLEISYGCACALQVSQCTKVMENNNLAMDILTCQPMERL